MSIYRVGGRWGRTIVRVGVQPEDEQGRRADDEIIGLMDTNSLAERAVGGLNASELDPVPCPTDARHCLCRDRGDCRVPAEERA